MLESKKASNTWKKRIEEPPHRKSQRNINIAQHAYLLYLYIVTRRSLI